MNAPKRTVLLYDPDQEPEVLGMEFRLTYTGPLLSSQPDHVTARIDKRRDNKHHIRTVFNRQLKRLWEITPFLKKGESGGPTYLVTEGSPSYRHSAEDVAKMHAHYGFNFVPLVTKDLDLICGLDILFLRPEPIGSLVESGDIDNRIKTLFDALAIPTANEQYAERSPEAGETPFYVLLEDDRLITKIAVESDQLLDAQSLDMHCVSLVITVRVRPSEAHVGNVHFT